MLKMLTCLLISFASFTYAEDQKFKVGVIAPLSGDMAEYGEAMRGGIELAKEDYPDKFLNIKFLYEDVRHDAAKAVLAFRKLREIDKIDLVYPFGVHLSRAVAPVAESLHFPVVAQSVDSSISQSNKYVVRFFNHSGLYADSLLSYLRRKKYKNIAIVLAETAYLEDIYKQISNRLLADEKIEIIDEYLEAQVDFRATISKLKFKKYDALGILLGAGQIGLFYRQLKEQGINMNTFGSNYFESSSEILASNGSMAGAVFPNNYIDPVFESRYSRKFGNKAQLTFAACAYEFALMIAENFSAYSSKLSSDAIMELLRRNYKKEKTVTGSVEFIQEFDVGGFFKTPVVIKQIEKNGSFKILN